MNIWKHFCQILPNEKKYFMHNLPKKYWMVSNIHAWFSAISKYGPIWGILSCRGSLLICCQIISEFIYEIMDFPKYHRENLIDFCPGRFYRLGTCNLFWLFPRRLYSGECISNIPSLNKLSGQKSVKFFRRYFGKLIIS